MTNNTLLTPALLGSVAIFIVATGLLMVAAFTRIVALAARRTSLSARTQSLTPLLVAVVLAAWLGWSTLAVREWVVTPEPLSAPGQAMQNPGLLIEMALFVGVGSLVLFASKTMRTLNAAIPPAWLIGVQVYRVAGAMFLWPFLTAGALPTLFALPAGIGDVLTGIGAPFVALAVARNRPGARAWAVAWNYFGILDLVVAIATAVLSHSTNVARFPIVIVPLFLGPPLGILLHLYSLRNLRAWAKEGSHPNGPGLEQRLSARPGRAESHA